MTATVAATVEPPRMATHYLYAHSFPDMPEITSIWLDSEEWPDATWVRPGQVHSYKEMSATRLQAIVVEKESKASNDVSCEAYWLLIVVDWVDAAQDQEITTTGLKLSSGVFVKVKP